MRPHGGVRAVAQLKASAPYRAWKRYGDANGDLLAAGVGYFAFLQDEPEDGEGQGERGEHREASC